MKSLTPEQQRQQEELQRQEQAREQERTGGTLAVPAPGENQTSTTPVIINK